MSTATLSGVDRLLFVFVLLLFVVFTYRAIENSSSRSTSSTASTNSSSASVRFGHLDNKGDSSIEPVALASIAVGPKARYSASFLLQSFIRNSEFNGVFYLITDSPSYFDYLQADLDEHPGTRVVYLRITDSRIGDVPLPLLPLSSIFKINRYGQTAWQRFSDFKRKRLEIKWLKTRLFSFIPRHDYVIFMDSDMLIGQPLQPFVDHCLAKRSSPAGDTVLTLFTDIGNTASLYHTGVIWLSREHSGELLKAWGTTISQGFLPSDQRAIEHSVNLLDLANRVAFITIDDETRFFAFINGTCVDRNKPYTFMHTTSYRLANGEKFGFTNVTLTNHFVSAYHTQWKPWSGTNSTSFEDQVMSLKAKMQLQREEVDRLENVPFKRPTMIALRKQVLVEMEAELAALIQSKGKNQFKDYGGAPGEDEKAEDNDDIGDND